jgi:hypothetical protein
VTGPAKRLLQRRGPPRGKFPFAWPGRIGLLARPVDSGSPGTGCFRNAMRPGGVFNLIIRRHFNTIWPLPSLFLTKALGSP